MLALKTDLLDKIEMLALEKLEMVLNLPASHIKSAIDWANLYRTIVECRNDQIKMTVNPKKTWRK